MNSLALVLYLVWFVVVFALRVSMQKRATDDSGVRRAGVAASGAETVAGCVLVVALVAGLVAPIAAMAGLAPLWEVDGLRIAGLVVTVAGIVLTFLAQVDMGNEWRIGVDKTERTRLVTDGAFGSVRNPISYAMMLTAIGYTFLVPNIVAVVALAAYVLSIEVQVRFVVEPHLRALHGNEYRAYEARVGRFVPLLGRARRTTWS